jgi:hypothetical protein
VIKFFEVFLATGGRAPAAIVDGMSRMSAALFNGKRRRTGALPPAFLGSNHLRQDVGLRPVDSNGRPI